ncbi:MAG: DUF2029 domain-containing protein [Phycisphaerae bacterium]|nr:DUF2029 domain-containing protein [Phycisphaerae bacterium]
MDRQTRWSWVLLLTLLLAVGAITLSRGLRMRYDFHHFYLDARYVWEHGELNPVLAGQDRYAQRQLPFYLPCVPLMLAPLTAAGGVPAACLWAVMQVLALAYTVRVLYRWHGPTGPPAVAIMVVAIVAALPAIYEAARFNQLSFLILALVAGGVDAVADGRHRKAGLMLGLATVVKLLPGVFLIWLLLKRRWASCASLVATMVAVAVLPCLIVFGPQKTVAYHQGWWQHNVHGAAAEGMTDPTLRAHFIDHRNQSIAAVLSRLMWSEHPHRVPWQPLNASEETIRRMASVVAVGLFVSLVVATRRPATALTLSDLRGEGALYALAMLVFSPLLRQYYLVWALPALVPLAACALDRHSPRRRLGVAGLVIWMLGMAVWIVPTARLYGVHLLILILLAAMLIRANSASRGEDSLSRLEPAE